MWCVPTVLVYALREDEVLLMHRSKEPNLGLWVAPGGKIKPGESPHDAARREMAEETGLKVEDLHLRGFCTLIPFLKQYPWFIHIFVATRFQGTIKTDGREGELAWVSLEKYFTDLPIPRADAIFAPKVLTTDEGCFQAKFVLDANLEMLEWVEY
jgi:ADP-ribose pyrophosphatase YjhB (NUDIX family)